MEDCVPCLAGFACDRQGINDPVTPCEAGYYCRYGANTTTPKLGAQADECFPGHYCQEGIVNYEQLYSFTNTVRNNNELYTFSSFQ